MPTQQQILQLNHMLEHAHWMDLYRNCETWPEGVKAALGEMTTLIDETYWKQQRDSLKNICPLSEQALLSSFPGLSQKSAEIIVMSLGWDYH